MTQQFRQQFDAFSKFGMTASRHGSRITLKQVDKWLQQAQLFSRKFTTADTGIAFKKFKKLNLSFLEFEDFLVALCEHQTKLSIDEVRFKLRSCGPPSVAGTTKTCRNGGVERLTDPANFTGTARCMSERASNKEIEVLHDHNGPPWMTC